MYSLHSTVHNDHYCVLHYCLLCPNKLFDTFHWKVPNSLFISCKHGVAEKLLTTLPQINLKKLVKNACKIQSPPNGIDFWNILEYFEFIHKYTISL